MSLFEIYLFEESYEVYERDIFKCEGNPALKGIYNMK